MTRSAALAPRQGQITDFFNWRDKTFVTVWDKELARAIQGRLTTDMTPALGGTVMYHSGTQGEIALEPVKQDAAQSVVKGQPKYVVRLSIEEFTEQIQMSDERGATAETREAFQHTVGAARFLTEN